MRIGVPKESAEGERRVALVPEVVQKLVKGGAEVVVERGAGTSAGFPDEQFAAAGATVVGHAGEALAADVVTKVQKPTAAEAAQLKAGTVLVSLLPVHTSRELVEQLAAARVTALGLELVPRITRAQSMDVLSSQATVAGYKAVLLAAGTLPRFLPMLTTAAGSIAPARAFILGAGVAGLQAIATARRLGAVVSAFDVRAAAREQVASLGAKFIEIPEIDASGAGGYAKELADDQQRRVLETVAGPLKEMDLVVTTAQIPGKPAPRLITAEMVATMKPGSVIVDLAAESGGNCQLTRAGEAVVADGVTILGPVNLPATLPYHASAMFAKNVQTLLQHLTKENAIVIDLADEITGAMTITHAGEARK
ncbi:MAG: Re/Si-specific NAD(P)(+) transhydrogenase subunit alpha [Gemmatimonadales bacterium]|nr:Re/Si-specific NAD(P)(+) transhydrogenase subunit alpha [Gemmatimonadales bacterium]